MIYFKIYADAERFTSANVCARCYGRLEITPTPDKSAAYKKGDRYYVHCLTCENKWNYAVMKLKTAEQIGQQNLADWRKARKNLADIVNDPVKDLDQKTLLEQLGYKGS